ncbi:MAG: hypothetical protein IPL12_13100 [Bacteroidetes bacterium]|nr:hypothetical protein [Bacteroidota bacterium]
MQMLLSLGFLDLTLVDIIDILLVAFILFQLYRLVRGSLAFTIFIGLLVIYVLSLVAKALELKLMSEILGSFISVGVIAVLIVFQPEIRRFLLYVGRSSDFRKANFWSALSLKKIRTGDYNQKEVKRTHGRNYVAEPVQNRSPYCYPPNITIAILSKYRV